jgi:RNA polymerase sigma-70 factor (ECF subfamily)
MTVLPPASPTSGAAPDLTTSPALAADLDRAHRTARALLGCDHLAADAVQEALLALWRQPSAPPDRRGWLVRAVVHRARHLRRTLSRRRRHECQAGDHCELHTGCDNPLHQAHAHELGERLDAAVATLPHEQRAPFELYVATGLDYRGIASELGLPIGTVRSRLHRARAALQELLHDDAPEPSPNTVTAGGDAVGPPAPPTPTT